MSSDERVDKDAISGGHKRKITETTPSPKMEAKVAKPNLDVPTVSNLDQLSDYLKSVLTRVGGVGYILMRGIPSPNEDEVSEDEEKTTKRKKVEKEYTPEQIATLRYVIMTDRRRKCFERMKKAVLGDQADERCGVLLFDTSFSDHIFDLIPKKLTQLSSKKDAGEKFDILFGLTFHLNQYTAWAEDYEDEETLQKVVRRLGSAWKKLLARTDAELGIDAEITRPGAMALLDDFAKSLDEAAKLTFPYK